MELNPINVVEFRGAGTRKPVAAGSGGTARTWTPISEGRELQPERDGRKANRENANDRLGRPEDDGPPQQAPWHVGCRKIGTHRTGRQGLWRRPRSGHPRVQ